MALDGGTLVVDLVANGSKLSGQIAKATQDGVNKASSGINQAAAKLQGLLLNPLVLAGAAAGALAFQFEDAFAKISSVSNAGAKDIAAWREEVLELSKATAQSPKELADALFFLASAGLKAGQEIEVLNASAKASAVGLGETQDVARLTANVLNAYADSGITAAQVTDTLVAAVREGTADADEFSEAIGRILPIASKAGVEFDEIVGSLAALSNIGLDVNEGVTAMRGLLQALVAPTRQSTDALKKLGVSTTELRDTLSEGGLPAALQLLEDRSGGNIDVLRELIPNVRALTGELGLTGENAEQVAKIFEATAHSAGSLDRAFAQTSKGPAFQLRQLFNQLLVIGTQFGTEILPVIIAAVRPLIPVLAFAARNAKLLLGAFLAYKALAFLPTLLGTIAASFAGIGAAGAAQSLGNAAFATRGFVGSLSSLGAVIPVVGAGIALLSAGLAQNAADAARNEESIKSYAAALATGQLSVDDFNAKMDAAVAKAGPLGPKFEEIRDDVLALAASMTKAQMETGPTAESLDAMGQRIDKTGNIVRNFAGLTREAVKKLKADAIQSFNALGGGLDSVTRKFGLTSQAAARAATILGEKQETIARDLRKLDDIPIGDNLKKRLLELGPDAVHAFVTGNKGQRRQIRAGLKAYDEAMDDTIKAVGKVASSGGEQTGADLILGGVAGINEHTGLLADAFAREVSAAIAAGRRAADAQSPSRKTALLGGDLMAGLVIGMRKGFPAVGRALATLVDRIREHLSSIAELEDANGNPLSKAIREQLRAADNAAIDQLQAFSKELDGITRRFEKLQDRIRRIRGAIRQGFDQFDLVGGLIQQLDDFKAAQEQFVKDQAAFAAGELDTAPTAPLPPDLKAFLRDQATQAQQLADTISALSAAGLNQTSLLDLASQGPNGVALGQALLSDPSLIAALNQAQADLAAALGETTQNVLSDQLGAESLAIAQDFHRLERQLTKFLDTLDAGVVRGLERIARRIANMAEALGIDIGAAQAGGLGAGTTNVPTPPPVKTTPPIIVLELDKREVARVMLDPTRDEVAGRQRNGVSVF